MARKKEVKEKGILVGYARVSTFDQDPQLQIDALLESGIDERHLFEEKVSGKDSNRTKLKEALEFLKKGDVFVVWKLDRLGRSLQDLIRIIGDLKKIGVGFKSLTEGIDTTHPDGVLIFHIFGALAQFERELIQERARAGLEAARRDQQPQPGLVDGIGELVGAVGRVDVDQDRADLRGRQLGQHPLGAVGRPDADPVAHLDAGADQPARHGVDVAVELGVGPATPGGALHQCLATTVRGDGPREVGTDRLLQERAAGLTCGIGLHAHGR